MYTFLLIVQILLAIVIVFLVLSQPHEGEGMGALMGGGGTDTFLGTKTIDVLWKATVVLGTVFIILAIGLNLMDQPQEETEVQEQMTETEKKSSPKTDQKQSQEQKKDENTDSE